MLNLTLLKIKKSSNNLSSQQGNPQVFSALLRLTSVFGMGTGISKIVIVTRKLITNFLLHSVLYYILFKIAIVYSNFLSTLKNTQMNNRFSPFFIDFSFLNLQLSPRFISIDQLNTLLYLHFQPIYQLVFLESYYLMVWDILSQGGLHTQMLSAFIPSELSFSAMPLV